MANKRVSELAPETNPQPEDLLFLSDIANSESKRLALSDLGNFILSNGNISGSLYGTASYANQALSASFAPTVSSSYSNTSSWALNIASASSALNSKSASYASSSSNAMSSSYALTSSYSVIGFSSFSQYSQTASYLLLTPGQTNGTASAAQTSSYLLLIPGKSNGTASSANTASYAISSSRAISASYAPNSGGGVTSGGSYNISASWSSASISSSYANQSINSIYAVSASYASAIAGARNDYGLFIATTQSVFTSSLDMVSVTPTNMQLAVTDIEVYGTLNVPFTSSSSPTNGNVNLMILDRQFGYSQSLDSSPIYVGIGGSSTISGTISYPFNLRGEFPLYGLYQVYVSASNGIYFNVSRNIKFDINSDSNFISVTSQPPIVFSDYPSYASYYYTASSNPFIGTAANIASAGSTVTEILLPAGSGVQQLYYTWTLSGLTKITTTGNPSLIDLGGISPSIITMSVSNCGLTQLPTLAGTSLGYLDCSNNSIQTVALSYLVGNSVYNAGGAFSSNAFTNVLTLPISMSYINCKNNPYLGLPSTIPTGLIVLLADGLNILSTPVSFPDTIQTMSFGSCSYLSSFASPTLPAALKYFDCHSSSLVQIPSLPTGVLYCDVSYCQMNQTTIGYIGSGLVANGLHGGTLKIIGNANSASAPGIVSNIATLRTNGWTVDGH